jgi:hypothetical protein
MHNLLTWCKYMHRTSAISDLYMDDDAINQKKKHELPLIMPPYM